MSEDRATPCLSVIMIVGSLRQRCERCLKALCEQTIIHEIEIVLVDVNKQPSPLKDAAHPAIQYIHAPESFYAQAKTTAIQCAKAEFVAFIEEHAVPDREWAEHVIKAFREEVAVVVYTYKNLNPKTFISRAFILFAYGRWMDDEFSGYVTSAPGNSIAYRRSTLLSFDHLLPQYLNIEYLLHQELLTQGWKMYKTADALIAHENHVKLRFALYDIGLHQQFLGSLRVTLQHWSLRKRLQFTCGMVIFPIVQCWRLGKDLRASPRIFRAFWQYLPVLFVFSLYGSWREAIGYLNYAADMRPLIVDNELMLPRDS